MQGTADGGNLEQQDGLDAEPATMSKYACRSRFRRYGSGKSSKVVGSKVG
jgi:hypothetical protein